MKKDKILFLDGMNSIYRANVGFGKPTHLICQECGGDDYSFPQAGHPSETHCQCSFTWNIELNKCDKEPDAITIITFNFFRNLRPLIEMFSPVKCFFVLEGRPQFRYDLYADYKANRLVKTAAASTNQKEVVYQAADKIIELLKLLPLTIVKSEQHEADDVIFTLCKDLQSEDLTVVSGDNDYIQLLQQGFASCKVYNPIKKTFMQAPMYPYTVFKCLRGDKSDNIPTLVSEKKALKIISSPEAFQKFLSLEENRANFNINRQLIEFRQVPDDQLQFTEGYNQFDLLKKEFVQMEFQSIVNEHSWNKYMNTFKCLKY